MLLTLCIGLWTWHDKLVKDDRTATAAPYIQQIKDMQAKRDAEIATLKLAADKATAENKAKEQAWADAATKAKNEADKRTRALKEDAATAELERSGLLRDLAASRSQMLRATIDSVHNYADTLSVVFEQCVGAYQELAGKADSHASDTQLIMNAWPVTYSPSK